MTLPKQPAPILFGNKNQEVDIPDFLKKPQETRVTVIESILQETLYQEYKHGIKAGLIWGFLTGILIPLIIGAVLTTLGII